MKIGILTLPLHANYGGILQAYALQTVLERERGDIVKVIDKSLYWNAGPFKRAHVYLKRISRIIRGRKVNFFAERNADALRRKIGVNTEKFIENHIHRMTVKEYSDVSPGEFDAIVVGSDQIWRPEYFIGDIRDGYLAFARNWKLKRVAYAASFGSDEWEYSEEMTRDCAGLLKMFDAVSVRESSGVTLCKRHLGADAVHVLDPVMLLDAEDYLSLVSGLEQSQQDAEKVRELPQQDTVKTRTPFMAYYILDMSGETEHFMEKQSKSAGLYAVNVNSRYEDPQAPVEERVQPPVESWLKALSQAEYIVTDSFHACVFSILFRKPFAVVKNVSRGAARILSLLEMFGLQDRLVSLDKDKLPSTEIDYGRVYARLAELRQMSMDFLRKNLFEH